MPFNGVGAYSLPAGSLVADGTTIDAADHNTPLQDIEAALSATVLRNGAAPFTANQSMGGNKLTSLAAGTLATDAPTLRQAQAGIMTQATAVGGTVNAITLTFSPPHTSYDSAMRIRWVSAGQNTGAVTVNVDGLGTRDLRKDNAVALLPGDLPPAGAICSATFDGTRFILDNVFTATSIVPSGSVLPYAGNAAPTGWLLCFGQAISRTSFATLFDVIGTTYGAGDGSTTFNLPDMRGRVAAGKDDMGGTDAARLTVTLTGVTTAGSAVITGLSSTAGLAVGMAAVGTAIPAGRTIASIDSATQVTLNSGTSVTAATGSIRFAFVDGLTLGAAGGDDTHTLTIGQMPSHGHPFRATYVSTSTAGSDTTGGFMTNNGSAATQTAFAGTPSNAQGQQIGGSGGGQAHPIVQPTVILNYIIKT